MNNSLKSIIIISLSSFLLLELGFFLEGFLQYILFSLVTIIYFVLLFLFYGFMKSKPRDSKKTFFFVLLVILPLLSAFFNPTFYLHGVSDKKIALVATQHVDHILVENTKTITLLKDSTYRLKEFGFWMNTTDKGRYHIEKNKITLVLEDYDLVFKVRNIHKQKKIYAIKYRRVDFSNCFLIDKIDNTFFLNMQ
ncbi:MAG: hypothetical protein V4622_04435 [Bacteroidota bacterium]